MGSPIDFNNFMTAVIHKDAFKRISSYIDYAKNSDECKILQGGNYDDTVGYFVEPTIILTTNHQFKTMQEEIFGPVVTLYVYDDCLLYTSPSPRDPKTTRMPSSA